MYLTVDLDTIFGKFEDVCIFTLRKGFYLDLDFDIIVPKNRRNQFRILANFYDSISNSDNSHSLERIGFDVYWDKKLNAEGIRMRFKLSRKSYEKGLRLNYGVVYDFVTEIWHDFTCVNMFKQSGKEFDEITEIVGEKKGQSDPGITFKKLHLKFTEDIDEDAFKEIINEHYVKRISANEYWIDEEYMKELKKAWYLYF